MLSSTPARAKEAISARTSLSAILEKLSFLLRKSGKSRSWARQERPERTRKKDMGRERAGKRVGRVIERVSMRWIGKVTERVSRRWIGKVIERVSMRWIGKVIERVSMRWIGKVIERVS